MAATADVPRRAEVIAIAIAGALLTIVAAVVTLDGNMSDSAWLEAAARGLEVAVPVGAGLYAVHLAPFRRFGALLIATGALAAVATLSESADPLTFSIGRLAGWAIEPLVLYLILAFPSGRLGGRADRVIMAVGVAVCLVLYFPTALLVQTFPTPFPWAMCGATCPDNALMLASSEPAWIEDVLRPVREVLTVLVFGAATVRVAMRLRSASHVMRRALAPVLVVAALRLATFAAALAVRLVDQSAGALDGIMWALALGLPLLAAAFLVGIVRWRLFLAGAMRRLTARLAGHPQPEELRAALAEAFDDPTLEVVFAPEQPHAGPGRASTEIRDGDRVVATVVHDEALRGEEAFIGTATAYAVMALDNQRLAAEAAALLAEVDDARARIRATADDERRRIERDLHDGAQQRLVALRIRLELAAERIDGPGAEAVRRLGAEVDEALEDLRSLARGIYPSPLADHGIVAGLESVARHAALPTRVVAGGIERRYPREVESAVYFSCLEAVQNAAKHAGAETTVVIEVTDGDGLRFEVRDDGGGFDPARAVTGIGFTSMRDRLATVGGRLAIVSSPGRGTRVIGTVPPGWCEHEPRTHAGGVGMNGRGRDARRG